LLLVRAEPYGTNLQSIFWEMVGLARRIGIVLLDLFLYPHPVRN
jgi:hypothetical protein